MVKSVKLKVKIPEGIDEGQTIVLKGEGEVGANGGPKGDLYIVVHSGSRHIGNEVAKYYQEESFKSLCGNARFQIDEMIEKIREDTCTFLLNVKIKQPPQIKKAERPQQTSTNEKFVQAKSNKIVGRNDPCPCGSGLKYKKCCGK